MAGALIYYLLIAAFRDKLTILVLLGAVLSVSLSLFLGSAALIEQGQFSTVYMAGILRIFGVCALSLFCVSFIRRSFETKDIEFLLTRPVSRRAFILSYAAGFSILAVIFALFIAAVMYANLYDTVDVEAFSLWAFSLCMEYIIIINAALFFSMVLTTTTGATMAVFGFYALGRMSGHFLGIVDSGKANDLESGEVMEFVIQVVSVLTPRLDLMAQSSWLIYGQNGEIGFAEIGLQGLVYVSLLVAATMLDLMRKQF